jgi:hypothetical protein
MVEPQERTFRKMKKIAKNKKKKLSGKKLTEKTIRNSQNSYKKVKDCEKARSLLIN